MRGAGALDRPASTNRLGGAEPIDVVVVLSTTMAPPAAGADVGGCAF